MQDYLKFDINYFGSELSHQLDSTFCSIKENEDFEELPEFSWFYRVFLNLLNIQEPLKSKMLIGNSPFMTKTLIAILIKPRLKTVLKNQIILQNKKNFCHKLVKKD